VTQEKKVGELYSIFSPGQRVKGRSFANPSFASEPLAKRSETSESPTSSTLAGYMRPSPDSAKTICPGL
jgi:hypothetical protein